MNMFNRWIIVTENKKYKVVNPFNMIINEISNQIPIIEGNIATIDQYKIIDEIPHQIIEKARFYSICNRPLFITNKYIISAEYIDMSHERFMLHVFPIEFNSSTNGEKEGEEMKYDFKHNEYYNLLLSVILQIFVEHKTSILINDNPLFPVLMMEIIGSKSDTMKQKLKINNIDMMTLESKFDLYRLNISETDIRVGSIKYAFSIQDLDRKKIEKYNLCKDLCLAGRFDVAGININTESLLEIVFYDMIRFVENYFNMYLNLSSSYNFNFSRLIQANITEYGALSIEILMWINGVNNVPLTELFDGIIGVMMDAPTVSQIDYDEVLSSIYSQGKNDIVYYPKKNMIKIDKDIDRRPNRIMKFEVKKRIKNLFNTSYKKRKMIAKSNVFWDLVKLDNDYILSHDQTMKKEEEFYIEEMKKFFNDENLQLNRLIHYDKRVYYIIDSDKKLNHERKK